MIRKTETQLWNEFFSLDSVGLLQNYLNEIDVNLPAFTALKYYAGSWCEIDFSNPETNFSPTRFVSKDLSAIKYGSFPVIFEGTNHWSWKPYVNNGEIHRKIKIFERHIARMRALFSNTSMCVLLIMEKDHLISSEYKKESRFSLFEESIADMAKNLENEDVRVIFKSPLNGIASFMNTDDFLYRDSHLPSRAYINYFANAVDALYSNWSVLNTSITMKQTISVGDLNDKFDDDMQGTEENWLPDVPGTSTFLIDGEPSFAKPLGSTWQRFETKNALIDKSVGIFGDSHSSIYDQRKLTYLFASTHRSSDFFWNPCGLRTLPESMPYDSLIFEVSSRFIV